MFLFVMVDRVLCVVLSSSVNLKNYYVHLLNDNIMLCEHGHRCVLTGLDNALVRADFGTTPLLGHAQ